MQGDIAIFSLIKEKVTDSDIQVVLGK